MEEIKTDIGALGDRGIRCPHSNVTEGPDLRNENRYDDRPTHYHCLYCDSWFPLIGDTDRWVIYVKIPTE